MGNWFCSQYWIFGSPSPQNAEVGMELKNKPIQLKNSHFASYFIMGGHKFERSNPETFLFGDISDLQYFGNTAMLYPYKAPMWFEPVRTLKSLVHIRKDSLKLIRINNCNPKYNIEFVFDADVKISITIYYYAIEFYEPGGKLKYCMDNQSQISNTYNYENGYGQTFKQPDHVIDPKHINSIQNITGLGNTKKRNSHHSAFKIHAASSYIHHKIDQINSFVNIGQTTMSPLTTQMPICNISAQESPPTCSTPKSPNMAESIELGEISADPSHHNNLNTMTQAGGTILSDPQFGTKRKSRHSMSPKTPKCSLTRTRSSGEFTAATGDPAITCPRYPIVICCVTREPDVTSPQTHVTIAKFETSREGSTVGYVLKPLKQKLHSEGLSYLIQDIFGIENKNKRNFSIKDTPKLSSNIIFNDEKKPLDPLMESRTNEALEINSLVENNDSGNIIRKSVESIDVKPSNDREKLDVFGSNFGNFLPSPQVNMETLVGQSKTPKSPSSASNTLQESEKQLYTMDHPTIPENILFDPEKAPANSRFYQTTTAIYTDKTTYAPNKEIGNLSGEPHSSAQQAQIPTTTITSTSNDEDEEDIAFILSQSDCLICLSGLRDTVLLPCRHLCICHQCATVLRYQDGNCPVCRVPFKALLRFKAMRRRRTLPLAVHDNQEDGSLVVSGSNKHPYRPPWIENQPLSHRYLKHFYDYNEDGEDENYSQPTLKQPQPGLVNQSLPKESKFGAGAKEHVYSEIEEMAPQSPAVPRTSSSGNASPLKTRMNIVDLEQSCSSPHLTLPLPVSTNGHADAEQGSAHLSLVNHKRTVKVPNDTSICRKSLSHLENKILPDTFRIDIEKLEALIQSRNEKENFPTVTLLPSPSIDKLGEINAQQIGFVHDPHISDPAKAFRNNNIHRDSHNNVSEMDKPTFSNTNPHVKLPGAQRPKCQMVRRSLTTPIATSAAMIPRGFEKVPLVIALNGPLPRRDSPSRLDPGSSELDGKGGISSFYYSIPKSAHNSHYCFTSNNARRRLNKRPIVGSTQENPQHSHVGLGSKHYYTNLRQTLIEATYLAGARMDTTATTSSIKPLLTTLDDCKNKDISSISDRCKRYSDIKRAHKNVHHAIKYKNDPKSTDLNKLNGDDGDMRHHDALKNLSVFLDNKLNGVSDSPISSVSTSQNNKILERQNFYEDISGVSTTLSKLSRVSNPTLITTSPTRPVISPFRQRGEQFKSPMHPTLRLRPSFEDDIYYDTAEFFEEKFSLQNNRLAHNFGSTGYNLNADGSITDHHTDVKGGCISFENAPSKMSSRDRETLSNKTFFKQLSSVFQHTPVPLNTLPKNNIKKSRASLLELYNDPATSDQTCLPGHYKNTNRPFLRRFNSLTYPLCAYTPLPYSPKSLIIKSSPKLLTSIEYKNELLHLIPTTITTIRPANETTSHGSLASLPNIYENDLWQLKESYAKSRGKYLTFNEKHDPSGGLLHKKRQLLVRITEKPFNISEHCITSAVVNKLDHSHSFIEPSSHSLHTMSSNEIFDSSSVTSSSSSCWSENKKCFYTA